MSSRIYKTAPAGSSRPYTFNWLNLSKYCQETELLPMVLLRWLSSWFLISRETFKVHQKDTLDLAIHSSCLKDLHDRGCLRLKQVLSREFKSTSPPLTFFPSSTHISPLVTRRVLKNDLSKEKPWESYEQTPQKLRLRKIFQISKNAWLTEATHKLW